MGTLINATGTVVLGLFGLFLFCLVIKAILLIVGGVYLVYQEMKEYKDDTDHENFLH